MPLLPYANLAKDTSTRKDVVAKLCPLIQRTRDNRRPLSDRWLRHQNIWHGRHDSQSYKGRLNVYLKTGRRVIENWVTKLKQDLFPVSGKWAQVSASTQKGDEQIAVLEAILKYQLRQSAVRRKSGPWLRTLVTLGTAPLDIGWRYSEREVPTLLQRDGRWEEDMHTVVDYLGPTLRMVSPFRWYVYPASQNDLADTTLQFEDYLLSMSDLEALSKKAISPKDASLGKHVENLSTLKKAVPFPGAKGNEDKFSHQTRLLQARGLSSPVTTSEDPNPMICVTKAYWKTDLGEESEGQEGETEPTGNVWYQLLIANDDVVLQCRRVPFWHGQPSYVCGKFAEVEEEFYGYGVPDVFDSLQYFTNDILNQSGDALTWSLNPIAGVDPFAVQDPTSIRMKPGAKWLVRNPHQSIAWMEPPKESGVVGQQAVQQLVALMNDVANVAPYGGAGAVGRSRGRAVQTATGIQLVANEALVQVSDVTQGVEDLVFNPMLRRYHDLTLQCLEIPLALRVEGARGAALIDRTITREDVIGDYAIQWTASVSSYNQQVLTQQMISFLQIAARIPPELLAQQNVRINYAKMLRDIWSTGMQLPDGERVIESISAVNATDAKTENDLFQIGRGDEVMISPADDDRAHVEVHAELMQDQRLDTPTRIQVAKHIQRHAAAAMAKQLMAQQQAMQQAGQQGMPGGPGLPPPNGAGGPPQGPGLGPKSQSGSGDLALPNAPGRMPVTTSPADVMRQQPRPGATGASGFP